MARWGVASSTLSTIARHINLHGRRRRAVTPAREPLQWGARRLWRIGAFDFPKPRRLPPQAVNC